MGGALLLRAAKGEGEGAPADHHGNRHGGDARHIETEAAQTREGPGPGHVAAAEQGQRFVQQARIGPRLFAGCLGQGGAAIGLCDEGATLLRRQRADATGYQDRLVDAGAFISAQLGRKPNSRVATAILNKRAG